ncbi:protein CDV3 homolog isoform X1 [Anopheles cruzii]|uniref:protein CDV3 homolog isoform X1 n=1 Tax=Anopheles cruzii TaxID=68878 RepID=UPI0022EC31B2|nr:protein CDV3 homolog isoform X1 [Anopheles cruzii]
MADLDDFFAKKDKKKGKGKKFVTAEEIAKQLDDTSKRAVESKMKKSEPTDNKAASEQQAEDEWKEFEEQKKDYTGLKLAQLTIDDEGNQIHDPNLQGDSGDGNMDGDGEEGGERDPSKPWNKLDATAAARAAIPSAEEPAAPTSNVYISPALKSLRAKQKKGAPDLKNEEYFPTLGVDKPEQLKPVKKDPTFEDVKHGVRVKTVEKSASGQVSVGNRYTSLSNNAS